MARGIRRKCKHCLKLFRPDLSRDNLDETAQSGGESAADSGGNDSRWPVSWQGLFLRPFVPKPNTFSTTQRARMKAHAYSNVIACHIRCADRFETTTRSSDVEPMETSTLRLIRVARNKKRLFRAQTSRLHCRMMIR
jgi:hypothetical protein